MTKYYIACKEVGFLDCEFYTEGDNVEQVVERCAAHGRIEHNIKGFGPEVFAKMRPHIRTLDETPPQA